MSQVVFILGAGASVHAGVPVMDSFYGEALRLKRRGDINKADEEHFANIIYAYESLRRLYSNFVLEPKLSNIETIYGIIEMGNLIKIFPDLKTDEEITKLKTSINKFIVRTLELKTKFALTKNKEVISPVAYNDLVNLIIRLEEINPSVSCSILTFNYDIALDFILYREFGDNVNYCLDKHNNKKGFKLIKLHGSINWGLCQKCKEINPISATRILHERMYQQAKRMYVFPIQISSLLKKSICLKCSKKEISDLPLIVPPTWNKTEYHVHLTNVWWHAARELSTAEVIIIIGYSLPESDLFFKYLLSLGGIDFQGLTDFIVIDKIDKVIDKYYKLLGREIRDDKFNMENSVKASEFRPALKHIHTLLKSRYGIL